MQGFFFVRQKEGGNKTDENTANRVIYKEC